MAFTKNGCPLSRTVTGASDSRAGSGGVVGCVPGPGRCGNGALFVPRFHCQTLALVSRGTYLQRPNKHQFSVKYKRLMKRAFGERKGVCVCVWHSGTHSLKELSLSYTQTQIPTRVKTVTCSETKII